jgi:hypothetical protein
MNTHKILISDHLTKTNQHIITVKLLLPQIDKDMDAKVRLNSIPFVNDAD